MIQNYYENSYRTLHATKSLEEIKKEVESNARGLFSLVIDAKTRFLEGRDWSELKILETGGGEGGLSLLLANLGAQVTMIDFSEAAVEMSQRLAGLSGLSFKSITGDITHPDIQLEEKFDIIIDSHLLHCITGSGDRSSYLQFVREHMSRGGLFICETMVHKKNLFIPDGFMFDPEFILWQNLGEWTPIRKILDSLDLEVELKQANLDIISFFYYAHFVFVPHAQFMELPTDILPASVRLVARNKTE